MYPHLATVPSDAPEGIDTEVPLPPPLQWDSTSVLIPIDPSSSESSSGSDHNEDQAQLENSVTTWHDVALSIAAEMMAKVRTEIYEKLGYSTSAVWLTIPIHTTPS
jgi:DNA polymerase eta